MGSSHVAVVGAVLVAAILHASWNALLKDGRDRLAMVVLLDLTAMALSALLLPLATSPAPASWGLLGLSVLLHTGYKVLLMQSYQVGDLNQVYPLARGTAPLLVAVVAGLFLGEHLGPWQLAGLVGVCGGLVLLLEWGRATPHGRPMLGLAVATGVAIAAYTITDGLGVRRSGTDLGYVAWLFLLGGLPIPLWTLATQRRRLGARVRDRVSVGFVAGALSLAAYGLVIWAQRRDALAVVAALRETSVLVAALIGTLAFSERFGRRRVLAAACITAGIVLLNLPR
jgi:drug/metabolite transporter (DMT)-like permease